MDTGVRASAAAGLVALALSVIVAIFSRVPFGILVLRAVVVSLAVFGLAYGIIMLLKRQLPELFGDAAPYAAEPSGAVVDISIDDNSDLSFPAAAPIAAQAPPEREEAPAREAASAREVDGLDQLEREVEDLHAESLLPREAGAQAGQGAPVRPSVTLDELDVLPDMDSMSDSFSSEVVSGLGAAEDDFPAGTISSGDRGSASSSGAAGDPAVLAKAVQTLLKRDQKG